MLVGLYTVRVVLNTLGVEDYGIYNVVAGVVAMFSFLSNSLANASQRYFSFEIGRSQFEQLKKIFNLSITIYVFIVILILLLAETIGLWFLNNKLVIPPERKDAVQWIYQSAILSFILTMLTTPYMASVIAHENMRIYAYIGIIEAILKLVVVFVLQIITADKLKLYGILLCIVTFINTGIYRFVCTKKYKECRFRLFWDIVLFKELISFVGWNLFGTMASLVRNQGINILLNIYFGPVVNAARAIARQVDSVILSFIYNINTAARPQIVKYYASGNKPETLRLVFRISKLTIFLLFFFVLPVQLELPAIFKIWLREFPEYTIIFTRLILVNLVIDSFCYPLISLSHATGKIKIFQLGVSGCYMLNLPVGLILLNIGFPSVSVFIIGIGTSLISYIFMLSYLSRQLHFSIKEYCNDVAIPVISVLLIGSLIPVFFVYIFPVGTIRLFITIIVCTLSLGFSVLFIGFTLKERLAVINGIKKRICHFL
jgi:O-antigen/teichoic acid export membrane protein